MDGQLSWVVIGTGFMVVSAIGILILIRDIKEDLKSIKIVMREQMMSFEERMKK